MPLELIENAAGRMIPTEINGSPAVPFMGVRKYRPKGGKAEVETVCGGPPAPPELGEKVVAAVKWVDGTVIDCVRQVAG